MATIATEKNKMDGRNPYQTAILVAPVLAFMGGIASGETLAISLTCAVILASLSAVGYVLLRHRIARAEYFLLALAFITGVIHHDQITQALPANHLVRYLERYPLSELDRVDLTATIVTAPIIHQPIKTFPYHSPANLKTRFWVDAEELTVFGKSIPVTGLVDVSIPGMVDQYQPGMQVRLSGRIMKIPDTLPAIPYLKPFTYYKHNFVFARVFIDDPEKAKIVSGPSVTIPSLTYRIQRWVRMTMLGDGMPTGEYTNDLLTAVILGKRASTENALSQAMVRVGAAHFLAVSGFNIFVLVLGVWWLGGIAGLSQRKTALLVIGFAFMYAVMADFSPSISRAAVMTFALCGGILLNRRNHPLNSMALAAGAILVINPNQLFQPGFQLSFAATLGLIILSKPIYNAFFVRWRVNTTKTDKPANSASLVWRWFIDQIKLLFSASLAASLAAVPLVMIHFNLFSLVGPLGSALMYLPATLLTFGGFLQLGSFLVVPALFPLLSYLNDLVSRLMSGMAIGLSQLPGVAWTVPAPAWGMVIAYFFILFFPSLRWRKSLILLIVAVYLSCWLGRSQSSSPWVYVSGPGEGMTAVVNTGEGLALVDCGGNQTGQTVNLIRNLSCNLLAEPRLAVLTAPEERYFNDAWALVESFPEVEFAAGPAFQLQATAYEPAGRFVQDASLRKRFWTAGGIFSVGKVRFQSLYPPDSDKTLCDGGAVLVTCRTRQILIATNLSDLACRLMGINYPHLRADTLILKGKIPLGGLETLIERAGIRQIVLQGTFHQRERFRLEKIAEEHHLRLIGDKASSGFLINLS